MSRWVSLNELSDLSAVPVRTLQHIRDTEPGVLITRKRGKAIEYDVAACNAALRLREAQKARREHQPTVTLDQARTRKALADAEIAELDLAKARGEVVPLADYGAALATVLDRLTARLRALPVRFAHLGDEAERVAETEVERIVTELHAWDEDVVDEQEGDAGPPAEDAA
jgi:phage terminase Nu1 subunit (DNA packaging protein)